ncbi:MAG TPA: galactosyldiacylglycerol synthase [Nocardioides sp.]|nr:galactosyldiacylglycerol synthase [Nocardioides sp.]
MTAVAIVTGSYGAGHDAAAHELARLLRADGAEVEVLDIVTLLPLSIGRLLRSAYHRQLRSIPRTWGRTLRLLEPGRVLHTLVTWAFALMAGRVTRAVGNVDLVLTTHPFGSQTLGHARRRGRLAVPACTYLTDASVHALWVHPGIDQHLAIHDVAAVQARAYGGRATTVTPAVPPSGPVDRAADPLAALEIIGPRAIVTGGSLGVGELSETALDVVATGLMTPVVLCGSDEGLRERLDRVEGVVALGWRDDVAALLATSDCVIQNAGGFTSLEALASGTPVLTYRPIPGHGVGNAVNLERAGLVPWVRTMDQLGPALSQALERPHRNRLPDAGPTVIEVLTGARAELAAA